MKATLILVFYVHKQLQFYPQMVENKLGVVPITQFHGIPQVPQHILMLIIQLTEEILGVQ